MRKTVTISVPSDDIQKLEKIQKFCKSHRLNFSGVALSKIFKWYDEEKENIQKSFYEAKALA